MQVLGGIIASSNPCPYFFYAMLCSFVQSSCFLFNCSQLNSVDIVLTQLCCHAFISSILWSEFYCTSVFGSQLLLVLGVDCAN